ncbi:hypothetical protein KKG45_04095 [bacterium]|nr:hypothetical protein [bacterium]MBU1072410.1 hypothetical protein [bacterium]MBU1674768.1 hypothetical protein [bacterium]
MKRSLTERFMLACALLLVVSYLLPISYQPVQLAADGRPAGLLVQMFPAPDAPSARQYSHFWQGFPRTTAAVFLLPLALALLQRARMGPGLRATCLFLTPVLGIGALALLVGMVAAADIDFWPFAPSEVAYGGYLAVAALAIYSLLALVSLRTLRTPPVPGRVPRRSPGAA